MENSKWQAGINIKTDIGIKALPIEGEFDLLTAGRVAYQASNYYRKNGTFHSIYIVAI